jgi:uncharacterized protein (TIGR02246 family)
MDKNIIGAIYDTLAARYNEGDLEGILDFYEPDAVFVPGVGEQVTGGAGLRKAWQDYLNLGDQIAFEVRGAVQNGDIALTNNEHTIRGTDSEGNPFTTTRRAHEVLRRQSDGRWLFIIDQASIAAD